MSRVSYSNRRSGVTQVDSKPQDSLNIFNNDTTNTGTTNNSSRRSTGTRDTLNIFNQSNDSVQSSNERRTSGRHNIPSDQLILTDTIDPSTVNQSRTVNESHHNKFNIGNQFDSTTDQNNLYGAIRAVSNTYKSNVQLTDAVDSQPSLQPTAAGNRSNRSSIRLTSEPDNIPLHTSKGLIDGKHNNTSNIGVGSDGYIVGNDDSTEQRKHITRTSRHNTNTFNLADINQSIDTIAQPAQIPKHLESNIDSDMISSQSNTPRKHIPPHLQSNLLHTIAHDDNNSKSPVEEKSNSDNLVKQRLSTRVNDRTGGSGGKSSIIFG